MRRGPASLFRWPARREPPHFDRDRRRLPGHARRTRALVADEFGFTVSGSAATARELRSLVTRDPPRVLVMDLMLQESDASR